MTLEEMRETARGYRYAVVAEDDSFVLGVFETTFWAWKLLNSTIIDVKVIDLISGKKAYYDID